ncbi:AgrD family cyclic lactone autoinducer peptide [Microcoleus sp. w1-18aA5]
MAACTCCFVFLYQPFYKD